MIARCLYVDNSLTTDKYVTMSLKPTHLAIKPSLFLESKLSPILRGPSRFAFSIMSESNIDSKDVPSKTTPPAPNDSSNHEPVIVGLYGLPGCGKSFYLNILNGKLSHEHYKFFEGSEVIDSVVPGGLPKFKKLAEESRLAWRQVAIEKIRKECVASGRVGVVTGHYMFWEEGKEVGNRVWTDHDADVFTHILYLDVRPDVILDQRLKDTTRQRPEFPEDYEHVETWQKAEQVELRAICRQNKILFTVIGCRASLRSTYPIIGEVVHKTIADHLDRIVKVFEDFRVHNQDYNQVQAERRFDEILWNHDKLETMLVIDGDKTLAANDTGLMWWKQANKDELCDDFDRDPLSVLFSGPMGYSYQAFRQAALLYEETADELDFDQICSRVVRKICIHPEFLLLLQLAEKQEHVGVVVMTCGLRRVWEKVLDKFGLSGTVKVIGGGRVDDGFIVTPETKGLLVKRLKEVHGLHVYAFGDSPLDMPMLRNANQAIVVTGDETTRSKSMDPLLEKAIEQKSFHPRQVLLPDTASPRLDTTKLPLVEITSPGFISSIFRRRKVVHASENIARVLMTPMRDARVEGPALREAHRRVGWYLATEFMAELIGVEGFPIPHVQGHQVDGFRLLDEERTTIVAMMRGGESMALGVNEALPKASFVHAGLCEDLLLHHLTDKSTVILVDSVINSGESVVKFVKRIRDLSLDIRIVVIVGVIQKESISERTLAHKMQEDKKLNIIALRLSENKFTGRGGTDTGNRLFNTTHIP